MNTTPNDPFDIANLPEEEQQEFFDDLGDLIMKKVFQKALAELTGAKRQQLISLIESSEAEPADHEKQEAVFDFLDKNMPNLQEVVFQEVSELQALYSECHEDALSVKA